MIKRLIIAALFLLSIAVEALPAITVGNKTTVTGDVTTLSISHNNNGDLVAICGLAETVGSANITDHTYNSVSMTQINSDITQSNLKDNRFSQLAGAAPGSNTASQIHDAQESSSIIVISLYGVDQTTPVDAFNTAQGNAANPSSSVTTVTDNSTVVACVAWEDGNDTLSATGWTEQASVSIDAGSQMKMWTKTTTTAGLVSFGLSSAGAADDYVIWLVAFKEAAAGDGGSRRIWK